jgi:tetratricopeptide (TPR) repeat protein
MKQANLVLMAALAAAGLVTTTGVMLPTQAAYAKEKAAKAPAAAAQQVSPAVAKPLIAAREALVAKNLDAALQQLQAAQAVETKTPYDQFMIDETAWFIQLQKKDYVGAAASLERVLSAGFLPEADRPQRLRALTQLSAQNKQFDKVIQYGSDYLKLNPSDNDIALIVAQARYQTKDYAGARAAADQVIAAVPKPPEPAYLIALASSNQLKDGAGVTRSLEGLVRNYPQPQYWRDAINDQIYHTKDDRGLRGLYRLMLDTNAMEKGDEYAEMGSLLLSGGYPTEAKAVLEKGMAANVFSGEQKTRAQGDLDRARSQSAIDAKDLPNAAAQLAAAKTANEMVGIGKLYFSAGQYDKAVEAIQKGLTKGGVTDANDANLLLGIANTRLGQAAAARTAFDAVQDPTLAQVARLWKAKLDGSATAATPAPTPTG